MTTDADEVRNRDALEASERRFRALVTHAADGIAVVGADGALTYISPSLCRMLGVREGEVIGRPGSDLIEPADTLLMRTAVSDADAGSELGPIGLQLRRADGTLLAVEGFRTDRTDDPNVDGVVWNLRDMSAALAAQLSLARSEERLQALQAGSSDVTMVLELGGRVIYAGASVERLFGYRPEGLVGVDGGDLVHPDDLASVTSIDALVGQAVSLGRPVRFRLRHGDGRWRWVEARFTDLIGNPAVGGIVTNIRDITDQHVADQGLRESEARYRSIVETAEEGIWIHDLEGRTTLANPKMASSLGTTVEELERMSFFDFVDTSDRPLASSKLSRLGRGISEQYEFSLRKVDGSRIDVLISASPVRDDTGIVVGALKMVTDIGDRKHAEAENARLALEDSLTGLASRPLVMDRITQILVRHRRDPGLAAVLFIDLDDFKHVNDSLGHGVGDELLSLAADRIRAAVRPQDTVGRFGGDEFVVVLDDLDAVAGAIAVAEKISDGLRLTMAANGNEVSVTASIGVALTPAGDASTLMRDADAAMYRAKELGGDRHELFDSSLRARVEARLDLEADLRRAIEQHQIEVHYQPVVALDGRVIGLEALARWHHATRGIVTPTEFIPLAESTGLIVGLGAWILDRACRDLAAWRALPGQEQLTVAVNLSGRQLAEPSLPALVAGTLRAHDLEPVALTLEITETVLMDDSVSATTALTAIHDLGVTLAVDDFGTGYSSLLYLRRFPVDALKLDRFFVAGIDKNSQDRAIVRSVIDLAHSLNLYAVAEGVETAGQLEALRGMGCDLAQGFHWSPALPPEEVAPFLAAVTVVPLAEISRALVTLPLPERYSGDRPRRLTKRLTVLIVDDSDAERSLLYSHLEASGWFRVVGDAADGHTAVAIAARTKPDLVLLDLEMPGMGGLATLPHLLRASPSTRVAILAGFISSTLRTEAMTAGAVGVFEKGCAYGAVVERLHAIAADDAVSPSPDLAENRI